MHLAVYERRQEAMGIVHAEPIYTNVFGVLTQADSALARQYAD